MPSLSHHVVHIILNLLITPVGSDVCAHADASEISMPVLYRALTIELFVHHFFDFF